MPYRKEIFANNGIHHITLRAIDDNLLFKDKNELYRAIYGIYEFNNANPVSIRDRREQRLAFKKQMSSLSSDFGELTPKSGFGALLVEPDKRKPLVSVLAFAFMPNHIHLLIRQLIDRGITIFMQKFGTGLAKYLNMKNGRVGHVFQNQFHAVPIEDDEQLKTALVYVFTNPVALTEPGFKERGVANVAKSIEFLENEYRWSSYWDMLGKKNFSSITEKEKDFVLEALGGSDGCRDAVNQWIKYKGELRKLLGKSFTLKVMEQLE